MTTLGSSLFPCYKGDSKNSGTILENIPENIRGIKWKKAGQWTHTPVMLDTGNLLCAQSDLSGNLNGPTKLTCVNAGTGATIWENSYTPHVGTPPVNQYWIPHSPVVINGDRALLKRNDPTILQCLNTADGSESWHLNFASTSALTDPVIGPGNKIFIYDTQTLTVYRISDVGAIETYWVVSPGYYDKVLYPGDIVLAADSSKVILIISHYGHTISGYEWEAAHFDSVYAFDGDGVNLWIWNGGTPSYYGYRFLGPSIAPSGDVYVVSGRVGASDWVINDNHAYCFRLDASTGANVFKADLGEFTDDYYVPYFPPPSFDAAGNIYVLNSAGKLFKTTSLGAVTWSVDVPVPTGDTLIWYNGPLIGQDGNILVKTAYTGDIFCYNTNGVKQWDTAGIPIQGNSFSHPIFDSEGIVYVATSAYLYALQNVSFGRWNPRSGIFTVSIAPVEEDIILYSPESDGAHKSVDSYAEGDIVFWSPRGGTIRKSR